MLEVQSMAEPKVSVNYRAVKLSERFGLIHVSVSRTALRCFSGGQSASCLDLPTELLPSIEGSGEERSSVVTGGCPISVVCFEVLGRSSTLRGFLPRFRWCPVVSSFLLCLLDRGHWTRSFSSLVSFICLPVQDVWTRSKSSSVGEGNLIITELPRHLILRPVGWLISLFQAFR